jgi:hypothetical protein
MNPTHSAGRRILRPAGLVILLTACLVCFVRDGAPRLTADFEKIEKGMSEVDVQNVIRCSPGIITREQPGILSCITRMGESPSTHFEDGSYNLEGSACHLSYYRRPKNSLAGRIVTWANGNHELRVLFGPNQKVIGFELYQFSFTEFSAKNAIRSFLSHF